MLYPTELRGHRQQLNQQLDYAVCVAPSRLLPILLPSDIFRNVQPSLGVGAPPAYSRSKSRVELAGGVLHRRRDMAVSVHRPTHSRSAAGQCQAADPAAEIEYAVAIGAVCQIPPSTSTCSAVVL